MKRLWLAALLFAVGCGTTLSPEAQTAASPDNGGLGPVLPQQSAPVTTAPTSIDSGPPTAPTTHSPKGAKSSRPTDTGTPSVTPSATRHSSGHQPIQIGFITTSVGNASSAGLNAGQSYSDQSGISALVAEYNRHGGLDGHRIIPVYGTTDTASSNWASQFQAVCAKFTEDNHVQVVIGYVFVFLPSFESCLAKKGIPHLYAGYQPGDVIDQQQYPTLVSTANPTTDGATLAALDGGLRSGVLNKSTKLGLLLDTCAEGDRALSRTILPWLKSHGISYVSAVGACAQGSTDIGGAVSAVTNAELRFASSGVKVILGGGIPALLFMQTAAAQGYHPQYLTSVGGAALEANAPASQMQNLHGFGWLPAVDVDPSHQPYARTAPQKACLAMLSKHGLQAKQYNDFLGAYSMCDGLNLYAKALATGATTATQVASAVMTAESTFVGALTYGGKLMATAHQHGGPGVYRQYAWSGACKCLQYKGPTYPMPSP